MRGQQASNEMFDNSTADRHRQKRRNDGLASERNKEHRKRGDVRNKAVANHGQRRRHSIRNVSTTSYFIIHVGPPKTATTTLQVGLQRLNQTLLDADHVFYGYNDETDLFLRFKNFKCHRRLRHVRADVTRNGTLVLPDAVLARRLLRVPCWQRVLRTLGEQQRQRSRGDAVVSSWLYSCECFGIQDTMMWRYFDWESVRVTLRYHLGIRLVAVVTYRRLADWLHSMYRHAMKWTGRKPAWEVWPTDPETTRGVVLPFVPSVLDYLRAGRPASVNFPFRYTDQMLDRMSSSNVSHGSPHRVQTRILDLHHPHHPSSPVTNLLCEVLPDITPRTCQEVSSSSSRPRQHANASSPSSSSRLVLNDAVSEERDAAHPTILNYDRLVVAAYWAGKVHHTDESLPRRHAGLLARRFHQSRMHEDESDLPWTCPGPVDLLWHHVLPIEGQLAARRGGTNATIERLRGEFDALVTSRRTCLVDTRRILQNATWDRLWDHLNREKRRRRPRAPFTTIATTKNEAYNDNNHVHHSFAQ